MLDSCHIWLQMRCLLLLLLRDYCDIFDIHLIGRARIMFICIKQNRGSDLYLIYFLLELEDSQMFFFRPFSLEWHYLLCAWRLIPPTNQTVTPTTPELSS